MSQVVVVGEAWGEHEERERAPFVGPSGKLLRGLLAQAGFAPRDYYLTNVFNLRPKPANAIANLLVGKKEALPGYAAVEPNKYIPAALGGEIERLQREIANENPNLIIAVGGTALSVLMRARVPITSNRGNLFQTPEGRKILGTYHPAAVLREWTLRPVVIADLLKAKRHAENPEYVRPSRKVWIEPSLGDMDRFHKSYMLDIERPCGIDIETKQGTITEISFAPRPDVAIVIPFYSRAIPGRNYWPSVAEECAAWNWVAARCEELRRPVFQNGLYDINYLWRTVGICVRHAGEDTMLLHHALQPEMKKGLGYLGSVYTDEPSWKMMRADNEKLKRGDEA